MVYHTNRSISGYASTKWGPDALKDGRGRSLESKETLTEEEKLQLEIKRLKQRKEESAWIGSCLSEFQAIYEYNQETGVSILLLCQILGVSLSGFYQWLNHTSP